MGCKFFGSQSRLTAREFRTISIDCQSENESVGNSESAACFLSIQSPSIRPQAGFIRRFQKTGTVSSGGEVQSKSALRGIYRTFAPCFNFASVSSQECDMKTSFGS